MKEVKKKTAPQGINFEDNPEPTKVEESFVQETNVDSSVKKAVDKTVSPEVDENSGAEKIFVHDSAVYEEVELPSKGKYYKGAIPEGKLEVRMMYQEEEEIMTSVRYLQTGKAVDMVLKNCIKSLPSGFTTEDLVAGDRVYLLMWLRIVSYGSDFETEIMCPFKKKNFEHTFYLDKCEVKGAVSENGECLQEPFSVELPVSKLKVWFRLPRGKDEAYLAQISDDAATGAKISLISERMNLLITKVEDMKTGEVEDRAVYFKAKYLKRIPARDSAVFKNELEYVSPGIKLVEKVISPFNGAEFKTGIPISQDFFSVKDHRKT
jgi:hypothetical protein